MMKLREEIKTVVEELPAVLEEHRGICSFSYVVAERKWFLGKQKLVYSVRFRIDDVKKEIIFSEMLKETGFGWGLGSIDDGMSPGVGFRKSSFRTGLGPREGVIEERSSFFGKKYSYSFDLGQFRERIKAVAGAAGYNFVYRFRL